MHGGHIGTPQGAKPHRYSAEARDDRLGGRASAAVNNELEAVREALRREKRRPSWKLAVTMAVIGLCIGFAAGAMFDNAFNECVDRSPGIKRAAIVGTDGSVWARSNGANEFRATETELKNFVALFNNLNDVPSKGADLEGIHYIVPRTEENLIFGKKGRSGFFAVKTTSAVLIAVFEGESSACTKARSCVENLEQYLNKTGY